MSHLLGAGHNNNNELVRTAPVLNQPLFQLINALDVCQTSTGYPNTLLHGHLYLTVKWAEVSAVWKPEVQQLNSVVSLHSSLTQCADELLCWIFKNSFLNVFKWQQVDVFSQKLNGQL